MKKVPLILFLLVGLQTMAQDTSVRIITQDTWPPGKSVPVTIEIARGDASGFARYYNDLPQGFSAENVISSEADFFKDNRQVNYVWLDLPEQELIVIQYLARADESLAGSFKITGRFDFIADGENRHSVHSESKTIKLDRSAEVEPVEIITPHSEDPEPKSKEAEPTSSLTEEDSKLQELDDVKVAEPVSMIDFRVQVSISSQRFSQSELEDRIGSKLQHGIKVLKTGNMFKYHSGSFKSYEQAAVYLNKLKANGVTDAFVVAFDRGNQISINEARLQTEK